MDIARLKALRELSTRNTMAAVAKALFLTPSAVSQQISQLEQETGVQLIERQGRGVQLTPAGELLVAHADRLFTVIDQANSDLAAIKKEVSGTLRVAVFPTVGSSLLPAAVLRVEQQYPYLRVILEEMEPTEGLTALNARRCDLAFVDDLTIGRTAGQSNIGKVALIDDALFALLPTNHRLAGKTALSVAELKDERWALDSAGSSFADFVIGLCRQAGYEPNINAHCRGSEILSAMVAEGGSVAVVAGLRLRHLMRGVCAVRLRPEVRRRISAAYRSGEREHPAIRAFLRALESSVRSYQRTPLAS